MRTKTLLLAAALSAAGIAASLAQSNVYSINVVGYVNQALVPGFTMVGNPLNNTSGNTVDGIFGQNLANGSVIYAFSGGSFVTTTYASKSGRWDTGTNAVNPSLAVGGGVFVKNGGAATNVTFVGEVLQGALANAYGAGFKIISSKTPQAGLLQTDLAYGPPVNGDTVYQFDPAAQNYVKISTYSSKTSTWGGTGQPNLGVAEAFWLNSGAGSWNRNFTVQ